MSYVFSAQHSPGTKAMKPVVFVIGASGYIGKATVKSLSLKHGRKVDIKAGVRNPGKVPDFRTLVGVTVVEAEMGQKEKLKETFQGVNVLYIIAPGSAENRVELCIATAEAAQEAGVQHLLLVSSSSVKLPDTVFGKQFRKIEAAVCNLGVPYTFLHLPFFFESYFNFQATIKEQSAIYGPADPDMPFVAMAVDDAGAASAAIMVSPEEHAGKTYSIVSDRNTYTDAAQIFTKALSREVKYVRVPYEDTKASFLGKGAPEWQVEGLLEYFKLVDEGNPIINPENVNDFSEITGLKPTSLSTWVMRVATSFK